MADVCYAHLDDVIDNEDPEISLSSFREWFKRGWMLQELIAPKSVVFLSQGWKVVGTKHDLAHTIEDITGVDAAALLTVLSARRMSVAMRMSWAAGRETRREEDKAYLLLGLFCINMPVVCGEGKQAFIRLQHEIMSRLSDHTIFAWNGADKGPESGGVLAPSPDSFRRWLNTVHPVSYAEYVERCRIPDSVPELFMTSYGIRMRLLAYMGDAYRATAHTGTINEIRRAGPAIERFIYVIISLEHPSLGTCRIGARRNVNLPVPLMRGLLRTLRPSEAKAYSDSYRVALDVTISPGKAMTPPVNQFCTVQTAFHGDACVFPALYFGCNKWLDSAFNGLFHASIFLSTLLKSVSVLVRAIV
ncbi:hypothetical protein A0H81_11007 [Grifola frondosa]|uniref:DUF8212 domain-containing protein n=1 Tax=Grifola frondosa TaxID=5627 RepID=A0A1C7LW25_GRIFR|nr:hypothetical protein A0H81_11007 [Grifola frondosa]